MSLYYAADASGQHKQAGVQKFLIVSAGLKHLFGDKDCIFEVSRIVGDAAGVVAAVEIAGFFVDRIFFEADFVKQGKRENLVFVIHAFGKVQTVECFLFVKAAPDKTGADETAGGGKITVDYFGFFSVEIFYLRVNEFFIADI